MNKENALNLSYIENVILIGDTTYTDKIQIPYIRNRSINRNGWERGGGNWNGNGSYRMIAVAMFIKVQRTTT